MNEHSPYMEPGDPAPKNSSGCLPLGAILGGMAVFLVAGMLKSAFLMALAMGEMFVAGAVMMMQAERQKHHRSYAMAILFLLLGVAMAVGGCYSRFAPASMREVFDPYIANGFIGVFPLIGILLIVGKILSIRRKKRICTEQVYAECVRLERSRSHKHRNSYTPVWSYYHDGEQREIRDNTFSNVGNPRVGESREIWIDPEYHEMYYEPQRERSGLILSCVLGGIFLVISGFIIVMLIVSNG